MVENKQARQRNLPKKHQVLQWHFIWPSETTQKCAIVAIILWNAVTWHPLWVCCETGYPSFSGWHNSYDWSQGGWEMCGKRRQEHVINISREFSGVLHTESTIWPFDRVKEALDWDSSPALSNTSWVYFINPNNRETKFNSGQRSRQMVCLKEK